MTSRTRRRAPLTRGSKLLLALAALGFLSAGIYLGIELAKPPPPPDFSSLREPSAPAPPRAVEAARRDARAEALSEALEIRRQPPPGNHGRPRIALIIDDLGRSVDDLDKLDELGVPLTYSVLPFETLTPSVVEELRHRGAEFLCHLPMEAKGGANPGPGALLLKMDRDELEAATRKALAAVPGAVGVNNHMGSGVSAEREAITTVLAVLAEDHLYYVDSRTSADTLGYSVARQLGMPAAERQVFLDAEHDPASIREQFARLLKVARERGGAIAIAHPHPETLKVLGSQIGKAKKRGFEFVTASSLLDGA